MRNLIPQWLIGFAFLYVVLQIITLELPQREERDDVMPRLFSHGNIEDIVKQVPTSQIIEVECKKEDKGKAV